MDLSLDLNPASPTYKDLLLQDGDLVINSGVDQVQQDLIQRLSFYQSEWFLDNTLGVPWFQQILVKNPDIGAIDAVLINTITNTPGITQLVSYKSTPSFKNRFLGLEFKAISTAGVINYTDQNLPPSGSTGTK